MKKSSKNKFKLVFGTYNTTSPGTSEEKLEKNYQKSFKSFLTILYNYPDIPVTLHYSGILFEWFENKHPEFLMLLNDMVKRGQIEFLGGGYYEPILPLLPVRDRLGQIEMLTTYIRKKFGKRPRGFWLSEQIWEPYLTSTLKASGMDYTFLNKTFFTKAGRTDADIYTTYMTEDHGKIIRVYPLSELFKQLGSGSDPEIILAEILNTGKNPTAEIITLLGDGNGAVDNIDGNNYSKWLITFLDLLSANKDKIEIVHPGKYLKTNISSEKMYFQATSYSDIMNWLKPEKSNEDVNCHYRKFLSAYPESNILYSKMMHINSLISQIRGDKSRKKTARLELWKGQCNAPFWHTKYGGIYNSSLRKSAYFSLIKAEKETRERGIFKASVSALDFDMDGLKEYLYQGKSINAYIHLKGGVLFELDYLFKSWNYLDTLSRHKEIYHADKRSSPDTYSRRTFIDHFFNKKDDLKSFHEMKYAEQGNFVNSNYSVQKYDKEKNRVELFCLGKINENGLSVPIEIKKTFSFKKTVIEVEYTIINHSDMDISPIFGSEINLSFNSNSASDLGIFKKSINGRVEIGNDPVANELVEEVILHDVYNKTVINLNSSKVFTIWSMPIETLTKTDVGIENKYQSSCFVPVWKFDLKSGESWKMTFFMRLDKRTKSS